MIKQPQMLLEIKLSKYILPIVILTLLAGYVGYLLGSNQKSAASQNLPTRSIGPSSLIKNQQALAVGTITKKTDTTLTLRADDNQEISFPLSFSTLAIYEPKESTSSAQTEYSSSKNKIKTNEKALVTLELQGDQYKVVAISYLPK